MTKRKCQGPCGVVRIETQFSTPRARICVVCKKATARKRARATRLWNFYGITLEEFDAILALQGGVCGGCKQKRSYALNVDHDHNVERALLAHGIDPLLAARGSIRGLLCRRCNKVLRDIRDSIPNLRQLADFLTFPPAKEVLT